MLTGLLVGEIRDIPTRCYSRVGLQTISIKVACGKVARKGDRRWSTRCTPHNVWRAHVPHLSGYHVPPLSHVPLIE